MIGYLLIAWVVWTVFFIINITWTHFLEEEGIEPLEVGDSDIWGVFFFYLMGPIAFMALFFISICIFVDNHSGTPTKLLYGIVNWFIGLGMRIANWIKK